MNCYSQVYIKNHKIYWKKCSDNQYTLLEITIRFIIIFLISIKKYCEIRATTKISKEPLAISKIIISKKLFHCLSCVHCTVLYNSANCIRCGERYVFCWAFRQNCVYGQTIGIQKIVRMQMQLFL